MKLWVLHHNDDLEKNKKRLLSSPIPADCEVEFYDITSPRNFDPINKTTLSALAFANQYLALYEYAIWFIQMKQKTGNHLVVHIDCQWSNPFIPVLDNWLNTYEVLYCGGNMDSSKRSTFLYGFRGGSFKMFPVNSSYLKSIQLEPKLGFIDVYENKLNIFPFVNSIEFGHDCEEFITGRDIPENEIAQGILYGGLTGFFRYSHLKSNLKQVKDYWQSIKKGPVLQFDNFIYKEYGLWDFYSKNPLRKSKPNPELTGHHVILMFEKDGYNIFLNKAYQDSIKVSALSFKAHIGGKMKLWTDGATVEALKGTGVLDVYDEVDSSFLPNLRDTYVGDIFWAGAKILILEKTGINDIIFDVDYFFTGPVRFNMKADVIVAHEEYSKFCRAYEFKDMRMFGSPYLADYPVALNTAILWIRNDSLRSVYLMEYKKFAVNCKQIEDVELRGKPLEKYLVRVKYMLASEQVSLAYCCDKGRFTYASMFDADDIHLEHNKGVCHLWVKKFYHLDGNNEVFKLRLREILND